MKALVTGGGGFLGSVIVRKLVERGDEVRSFSRRSYAELEKLGTQHIQGDLTDAEAISHAADGCDAVFHVAARPGVWGSYQEFYQTNVTGTENVLSACQQNRVPKLIYTSSPSVVFNGQDMEGVDESVPYPEHFEAHYPKTKAIAEQKVLSANSPELATVSLRPHLIWGPGDNHLVPRILARGRAGQLRRIGHREYKVDCVYVDNAADAHLLASDVLAPGATAAGKAYFITNDEPIPLWDMVNQILDAGGVPAVKKSISPGMAYAAGWLLETVHGLFGLKGEPRMTRFLARELSTAHWFDISAAKKDLGYEPAISMEAGMARLERWLMVNPESRIHPTRT